MTDRPDLSPASEWVEGTCRARFYVHAPHKVYAGVDAAGIVWTDCPGTGIWPIPTTDDVTTNAPKPATHYCDPMTTGCGCETFDA